MYEAQPPVSACSSRAAAVLTSQMSWSGHLEHLYLNPVSGLMQQPSHVTSCEPYLLMSAEPPATLAVGAAVAVGAAAAAAAASAAGALMVRRGEEGLRKRDRGSSKGEPEDRGKRCSPLNRVRSCSMARPISPLCQIAFTLAERCRGDQTNCKLSSAPLQSSPAHPADKARSLTCIAGGFALRLIDPSANALQWRLDGVSRARSWRWRWRRRCTWATRRALSHRYGSMRAVCYLSSARSGNLKGRLNRRCPLSRRRGKRMRDGSQSHGQAATTEKRRELRMETRERERERNAEEE